MLNLANIANSIGNSADASTRDIRQLINGFQLSQAIYVAAALGVADQLAPGPRGIAELASITASHPDALYRLLRTLAAAGLFREDSDRIFSLAPLGQALRSKVADSCHAWARYAAGPPAWQAWGHLLHSVQTGESAFSRAHGMDVWRYRAANAADGAVFDAAMRESSDGLSEAVLCAYNFSHFRHVIDVGGGDGTLIARLVARHASIKGTLFDRPNVVASANDTFARAGVTARCQAVAGDFFAAVPRGGDAHILKFILHNWPDESAVAILNSCRRALAHDSRLIVIERTLAGPNEGTETKFADLNMLVHPGGRERTRKEFDRLLAKAGFRLIAVKPLNGEIALIESAPTE